MGRRPLSHYLFDLDGTLIDTIELILTCYRTTLKAHRGHVPPDEAWLRGLGRPLWVQFREFSEDQDEIDAMVETYRKHNRRYHDQLIREYPGVRDAIRELRARGVGLGIVSSKLSEACRRGLAACRLDEMFEVLVGADDTQNHKPDPEPVLRALEILDAAPEETVFIGDSPHDIAAGRAAGVRTAAVLWGPFTRQLLEAQAPDYWLSDPSEIGAL